MTVTVTEQKKLIKAKQRKRNLRAAAKAKATKVVRLTATRPRAIAL